MLKQVEKKDKEGHIIICTVDENGVEQGPFEIHYTGGAIGKGTYKDGKWEGPYEESYMQDCRKYMYKNGIKEGLYEEFRDGQLCARGNYKNGKREGLFEEYEPWRVDRVSMNSTVYVQGKLIAAGSDPEFGMSYLIQRGFEQLQAQISQMAAEMAQMKEQMGQEKTQEAVEKLKEEKQVSEKIGNLKGRLEMISDPAFRKPIGPARTPERQAKAEEIIGVRRARTLLARAANKAIDDGDKGLFSEIEKIARPYALHNRRIELEQKRKRMERREKKGRG